jgi:arginine/ornithine transport system substrate-binding protein
MNRIIALVLAIAAASLFASSVEAQNKKLRIGVEGAYPPFSEIDPSGKLKGFDIDITNALCVQMKRDCELVQLAFDGMIPALQSRKIDAVIASMSITDERRKAVEFSNKYYRTPARFVVKAGSKIELTPAGLKGKRIGVQRSTTHDRYIADVYKDAQIVRYTKQDEVFLDLASGRLDAAFLDSIAADIGFLKKPAGKGFAFAGPEIEDRKYFGDGAGVALRKADTALRDEFNAAIAALRSNGTYKTIQDRYFDFDVYGSPPGAASAAAPAAPAKPAAAKK